MIEFEQTKKQKQAEVQAACLLGGVLVLVRHPTPRTMGLHAEQQAIGQQPSPPTHAHLADTHIHSLQTQASTSQNPRLT
jgi:hypothetical protein